MFCKYYVVRYKTLEQMLPVSSQAMANNGMEDTERNTFWNGLNNQPQGDLRCFFLRVEILGFT